MNKDLYLQLREVATTTCNNSYLLDNGKILTSTQYKALSFIEKLHAVIIYKYSNNQIIKL